jgi:alkylation response protein AidB-like acyl-CoA dehydrogenase
VAPNAPTGDSQVDVDRAAVEAAVLASIGDRIPRRGGDSPLVVLGAGLDDVEPGRRYLAVLADGGWAVPTWPATVGGRGATTAEAAAIAGALAGLEQPDLYPYLVGLHVVGPTLLAAASEEQRDRWLPAIARGDEIWCQLFSEPGAGSDLAALSTRAARHGDEWRVTGQKVWTSRAHYARWGLLLARSDPTTPKHAGITAFAVDMHAPGVEVRPLRQMNGDAHFSEVFLDDVSVPDLDRIGLPGEGWAIAKTALANERGAVTGSGAGLAPPVDRMLALGGSADAVHRDRAIGVYVDAEAARLTSRRARAAAQAGRTPGPEGSGSKLRGSAIFKATTDAALAALGPASVAGDSRDGPDSDAWQMLFLTAASISIRGGTDEIQRTIVGEHVLGLPAEPRVDTGRPFRDPADPAPPADR